MRCYLLRGRVPSLGAAGFSAPLHTPKKSVFLWTHPGPSRHGCLLNEGRDFVFSSGAPELWLSWRLDSSAQGFPVLISQGPGAISDFPRCSGIIQLAFEHMLETLFVSPEQTAGLCWCSPWIPVSSPFVHPHVPFPPGFGPCLRSTWVVRSVKVYFSSILMQRPFFLNKESLQLLEKKIIYFWLHCVFVAAHGLSLVAEIGGSSSFQCTGFSLQWLLCTQALELPGSVVPAHRLSCPKACGILVSRSGTECMSLELAGGLSTTGPPQKSWNYFLKCSSGYSAGIKSQIVHRPH